MQLLGIGSVNKRHESGLEWEGYDHNSGCKIVSVKCMVPSGGLPNGYTTVISAGAFHALSVPFENWPELVFCNSNTEGGGVEGMGRERDFGV